MTKKNIVITVVLHRSNDMEKPNKLSKDTDVKAAPKLLSGDDLMLNDLMNNAGLNYGLKKATVYANYAISQVTVGSSFSKLRTTGLRDCLMNI